MYSKLAKKFENQPILTYIIVIIYLSRLIRPSMPDFYLFSKLYSDSIIIGLIAYSSSISTADFFSRKHKYKINSNQELFALGMSNLISSFFKSFVSSGSLPRTALAESAGAKTQISTIIACLIMLAQLFWLSPFLSELPKACLAAIIIVVMVNLFKQFNDIIYYWKLDKHDFTLWIVTFISTILLNIEYGLCIGILTILIINTFKMKKL